MTLSRRALIRGGLASLVTGDEALAQYIRFDLGVPNDAHVDALIKNKIGPGRTPGLSLAVVAGGPARTAGYGLATVDQPTIGATAQTRYNIASAGKQFIATGIMLLVQDQAIGLDDLAVSYLQGGPPQSWDGITVKHLLTHTSGLPKPTPGYDARKDKSDAEVILESYNVNPYLFPKASFCTAIWAISFSAQL